MNDTAARPRGRLWRLGRLLEDTVLVVLLTSMILLAGTQILLRNGFSSGLVWADELLRIMVLWIGLAGALAASRDRHQIKIDILSRFLPEHARLAMEVLTALFTAIVCAIVGWHAFVFVSGSLEYGDTALGKLPAWWFQVILPAGFILIAWRYLVQAITDAIAFFRGPGQ